MKIIIIIIMGSCSTNLIWYDNDMIMIMIMFNWKNKRKKEKEKEYEMTIYSTDICNNKWNTIWYYTIQYNIIVCLCKLCVAQL